MARGQLQVLKSSGARVVEIAVTTVTKPNRWLYCCEAGTLFCDEDVAATARRLWPAAITTLPQPLPGFEKAADG